MRPRYAGEPMHLAADYVHPTPNGGRCRIRIYVPEDRRDSFVVVCTEPKDNAGMSVTNGAEQIASEVATVNRLPLPLVWIEHYEDGARGTPKDPHSFDLVTFASYEAEGPGGYMDEGERRVWDPSWKSLDRATMEVLIVAKLDA